MQKTNVFVPKNGAPIDLLALESIANIPDRLLLTQLGILLTETNKGLVLEGMEPNGKRPKKNGPPGVMQFSLSNFTLSPGVAIVGSSSGWQVIRMDEPELFQLEVNEKSTVKRSLILSVNEKPGKVADQKGAYYRLLPLINVVNQDDVNPMEMTVIANELAPNIWATDVSRMANNTHPIVESIMDLMDSLEDAIWESDRHGQPWMTQSLGREWKTYQTKAAVAVTAARMTLSGRVSTTQERVRCLRNLHWQLQRSVEKAGQGLSKWCGVVEAADQYSPVFSAPPSDWNIF
jgi:hypothetical protein